LSAGVHSKGPMGKHLASQA